MKTSGHLTPNCTIICERCELPCGGVNVVGMGMSKKPDGRTALSRLPRLLKEAVENPTGNTVHRLRTTVRRAEEALKSQSVTGTSKMLKQMKRIRKRAGAVRDLDVQLSLLSALGRKRNNDCVAVATELRQRREKQAKKISEVVEEAIDSGLLKHLSRVSADSKKQLPALSVDLKAIAGEFTEKLQDIQLSEGTLHGFRTETKKLKYRAELAPDGDTRDRLISELKKVQDKIGEWHDGVMLSETAGRVLGPSKRHSLISILKTNDRARYLEAIRTVNRARHTIPALFEPPASKKSVLSAEVSKSKAYAITA